MVINFLSEQFTLSGGYYYSPAFKQDEKDVLVSVAVWLSENGTASIQASLNETDWVPVENTSFTCSTSGLQTYTDCHYGLVYRLKIDKLPIKASILI